MALFGKKYSCQTCGMKFGSEAELREHSKMHMSAAKPVATLSCPACGASFRTQSELAEHKRKAHPM
jgi:predicted RNA-binding Zn-ribbon protein involved in translation (DUF1610 family)